MRLVIASREYRGVSSYSGGIGTFFALLAPRLAVAGHQVDVITLSDERTGAGRTAVSPGLIIHRLANPVPGRLWFLGDVSWSLVVDKCLRELTDVDIILSAEWGGDAAIYSARRNRAAVVTQLTTSLQQVLHLTSERPSRRLRVKYRIQRILEKFQTEHSDGIVASSQAIHDWTSQLWHIGEIHSAVIGNFTDVSRVRSNSASTLPRGFPQRGPVVLFVGRLEARKGVDVLVQSMQCVWREMEQVHLVLLGQDHHWGSQPMSEHLRDLAGGCSDRVHFLGAQSPEAVFAAFAASTVVAFPSLWENFSLATLEARAQACAIIVTSGSGFDDFVTDGADGLIVPPGDASSLSEALLRLLGDSELRGRLGRHAAAAEDARDTAVVHEFDTFLKEVAKSKRAPA